jgi:hypothetical protein
MSSWLQLLPALRVAIARHRRILAAACAGIAVLLILGIMADALRPPEVLVDSGPVSLRLRTDESAVPVLLADKQLAAAVAPGDLIDLVQIGAGADAHPVTSRSRVLDTGSAQSGFASERSALLVVAVPTAQAARIAAAGALGSLTLVLHSADR